MNSPISQRPLALAAPLAFLALITTPVARAQYGPTWAEDSDLPGVETAIDYGVHGLDQCR